MSSITIKTQYNGDIRRFNVNTSDSGSLFASIQATIAILYRLNGRSFTINYVDEEGDACCVGGDEETREALRFAADHGKVLKLNVVIADGAAPVVTPLVTEATPKAAAPVPSTPVPVSGLETKKPVVRPEVAFVSDVTIEDGSVQVAGSLITKTWKVDVKNNNGEWSQDVAIVAVNGGNVAPVTDAITRIISGVRGATDVSVPIRVPTEAGRHKYEYHLVTAEGKPVDGDYQLWADFTVRPAISAAFVSDVTIEDGMAIAANSTFKKVWSIKNDGVEQWPAGSLLVHNDGAVLTSPLFEADSKGVAVPTAQPNETVQVAVHVVAPSTSGRHHGEFHLTKPDGTKFGNDYALWTQINVPTPVLTPHEVISNLPKWMEDKEVRAAVDKFTRAGPATANASTSTTTSSSPKDVIHVGITCDGCNMSPIVGIRFKCSSCADYDLCANCEAKSAANGGIAGHSGEHSFIKMKVPFVHQKCGARRAESKAAAAASANWRAAAPVAVAVTTVPVASTPKSTGLLPIPFAPAPAVLPAPTPKTSLVPIPFAPAVVAKPVKKTVPKSQFTADITLPDGAQVTCGSVVVKRWSITNTGEEVWPEGTKLVFVGGALQPAAPTKEEAISISAVTLATPKQTVEVWARVQVPAIAGRHTGYFRLAVGDKRFGHRLWLDVVAVAQPVGTTPTPVVIGSSKLESKVAVAAVPVPVVVAATPSVPAVAVAAPVVAAANVAAKAKFATELAQLKELGYRDEDMLCDLLLAAGGRVPQVIDWLVTPVV